MEAVEAVDTLVLSFFSLSPSRRRAATGTALETSGDRTEGMNDSGQLFLGSFVAWEEEDEVTAGPKAGVGAGADELWEINRVPAARTFPSESIDDLETISFSILSVK